MTTPTACREAIRRLWDYLDGELSSDEHQAVEDHLAFCLRCCGELEFSRELRGMLDRTGQAAIPDEVQDRLERLLDDVLPDLPITLDQTDDLADDLADAAVDPAANGHSTHDHDRGATT
jgi:anti-sigma factor (TIGR02949 family)